MSYDLKSIYGSRLEKYNTLKQKSIRISKTISLLRLLVFLLAVGLIYFFSRIDSISGIIFTILLSAGVFIYIVKYHSRILTRKKLQEAFIKINKNELNALKGDYSQFNNGEEFNDPEHPYAADLDIFGDGSLFQFLNRTSTLIGKKKLAERLKNPFLKAGEIRENQEAIAELNEKLDWRQNFQAIGIVHNEKENDKERILNWVKEPPVFKHPIFTVLLVLIPLLTLLMIILFSLNYITFQLFIVYLVIPLGISGSFASKVNARHTQVSKTTDMLNMFTLLLNEIESKELKSPMLRELRKKLLDNGTNAGKSIKKLSAILTALDNRLNFVSWILFNGLVLWDILQMKRLENWQKQHKIKLALWFEVIAEIDTLNSFACYYYNNEYASFPQIITAQFAVKAESMGHPLINKKARVDNIVEISNNEFIIITGANMAGKSTYLRTIGVNLILGMCGAPVCAKNFRFSPIRIYTSIRTKDSLHKNESYFYSELKRLKYIIDELKNGTKLFVVLDEILKGTNSKDKHAGSEALLKQFISLNTSGIVATHDVALGALEKYFPDHIKNKCFEVDINGSRLSFDYKLKEGVSKNMNATVLMREMGITV